MVIYIIHIPFAYFGLWFFRSGEVKPKLCYRRLIRKINLDTKHCLRSIMNLKQATISSDKKKINREIKTHNSLIACLLANAWACSSAIHRAVAAVIRLIFACACFLLHHRSTWPACSLLVEYHHAYMLVQASPIECLNYSANG